MSDKSSELNLINVLKELSSPTRLEILHLLSKNPSSISQLAKSIRTSIPGVQKHLQRLISAGLIEKNNEGLISLSSIGKTSLNQLSFFEFLSKNKKYFEDHIFEGLPEKFIHRLGELNNSELIASEMLAWEKQRESLMNTKEFSYGMTIQVPLAAYDIFLKKAKSGVQIRGILGKNTIVSKGHAKLMEKIGLHKKIPKKFFEKRMVDTVETFIVVTEHDAFVSFSNKKNAQPDLSSVFYSKKKQFRQWCLEVFNHFWENSKPYDQSKLIER